MIFQAEYNKTPEIRFCLNGRDRASEITEGSSWATREPRRNPRDWTEKKPEAHWAKSFELWGRV